MTFQHEGHEGHKVIVITVARPRPSCQCPCGTASHRTRSA
jgi:hypothetical protein